MSNHISIRSAISDDALAIKRIHNAAYKISFRGYLPDEFLGSIKLDQEIIHRTQVYLTQTECYVAMIKNEIVGFLYVSYPEDYIYEIQALYVHPQFQKCGVGTTLVKNLWKNKQNYKKCIVWAMKNGPSLDFYKKMGFSITTHEKKWKFDISIVMLEKTFQ